MKTLTPTKTTVFLAALALAACGGGSGPTSGGNDTGGSGGTSGSGGSHAGGTGGGSGGTGSACTKSLSLSVETDVQAPGLPSTATVSVKGDATFAWSITAQPDGSELENSDLQDADQAKVTFHPQVNGDYELTVKVTSGDSCGEEVVQLTVQGYDVPFTVMNIVPGEEDNSATHVAMMVNSGTGTAREVGCVHTLVGEDLGDGGYTAPRAFGTATYLPRSVDDAAYIASRVFSDDFEPGYIEFANSQTTCDGDDSAVVTYVGPRPTPDGIAQPDFPLRFSPDGSRLLVATETDDNAILSIGNDGSESRVLVSGEVEWAPHFGWETNEAVLIIDRDTDAEGEPFLLRRVFDNESPMDGSTVILDCTGVAEDNVAIPTTLVLSTDTHLLLGSGGNLYRMEADDEGMYDCALDSERNTLIASAVGSVEVSDDGSYVTYDSNFGIFVASVDGSSEPQQISPDDGTQHFHPRFALGGRQVVWTSRFVYEEPGDMDEPPAFEQNLVRMYRANADGTQPFILWQQEAAKEETLYATGGTNRGTSCSFGLPWGSTMPGLMALALGGGLVLRRRRK